MSRVVELNARDRTQLASTVFSSLSEQDAIIVLRDVAEIHQLGATILAVAEKLGTPKDAADVATILRTTEIPSLEALALFYQTVRHLRDRRYISGLFSDLVGALGLPEPILIDSGFCRLAVPTVYDAVEARQSLFGRPEEFLKTANETERMLQTGKAWGNVHRDLDVSHYHFQMNFWFPLHDVDETRTLLLFPDAYRQAVPQYKKGLEPKEDPAQWGYGRPLQIPLRFGDTLVFHSQQLHASPTQNPSQNRFTCELRAAAACHDDNAIIYRRQFWNLGNFQPGPASRASAVARAAPLAEPRNDAPANVDVIVSADTAHAMFDLLFRTPAAAFAAAYVHRDDSVFAATIELDSAGWGRVVEAIEKLSWGEDLGLAVSRVLLFHKQADLAVRILNLLLKRTRSYFWALEAGRIAAEAGLYDLATTAFSVAEFRASRSDITLNRYTAGMPPPRVPQRILQLLPATAARAAAAFRRRAGIEKNQASRTTPTFDHSLFWPPVVAASFEHYDILATGSLVVALPSGCAFRPEQILDGVDGVAVGSADKPFTHISRPMGNRLPEPRSLSGSGIIVGDYALQRFFNGWYAIPKRCLPVDPVSQDILKLPGAFMLGTADAPADLSAALMGALASQHEHLTQEKAQLQQVLGEVSRRGGLRGIGKPHMDEDFLQYAFHDNRESMVVALAAALGRQPRTLRLIGPLAAIEPFAGGLRNRGHSVEHVAWSYGDPLPPGGLNDGILCQIPKSYDEWAAFDAATKGHQARLQPIWRLTLPWSLLTETFSKYDYNARSLEDLIGFYSDIATGAATGAPARGRNTIIERLQSFFPIQGKTVIEFGPSDGNHTSALLGAGAAHVLAVEGRPENVVKLLVAKHVMGWRNFDVTIDNFQSMGPWADKRYDLVYAHGVYYHCQNPLIFLDGLTRMSDAIFVGGWTATEEKPPAPWVTFRHHGETFRGKPYVESYHFLSGLASTSYMLDTRDMEAFFTRRGYVTKYSDITTATNQLGTEFTRMLVVKE